MLHTFYGINDFISLNTFIKSIDTSAIQIYYATYYKKQLININYYYKMYSMLEPIF